MKKIPFSFTEEQRKKLEIVLRCSKTPQSTAKRARIILGLMEGKSGFQIAHEQNCPCNTVYKWRNRFEEVGLAGLQDLPRSGQPRKISNDTIQKVLDMTMHALPSESTHWSRRLMSKYAGVTVYQVMTIWAAAKIRPHLHSTFNFSKDPAFAEKVIDIVGLYMNKHDEAIVLSVDEKTQIQALDHTQPLLQLSPGQIERHTHDYVRHGTTSLYAAFDIASGRAIGQCAQRHRAKEFLSFMNLIDRRMKSRKNNDNIHVILDNSSTHKTKEVAQWLESHPEYHFHFTPTSSSWLNAVESWFSRVERYGLAGKAFKSVTELREHLKHFIVQFNKQLAKPFVWTKDADSILAAVARAKEAAEQQHTPFVILKN